MNPFLLLWIRRQANLLKKDAISFKLISLISIPLTNGKKYSLGHVFFTKAACQDTILRFKLDAWIGNYITDGRILKANLS